MYYFLAALSIISVAVLQYILPVSAHVDLSVFDVKGRFVARLYSGSSRAGIKHFEWNGRDSFDNPAASGLYACRLAVGTKVLSPKMILIR